MMDNENWNTLLIIPRKSGYYKVKYFDQESGDAFTKSVYYDVKTGWDLSLKYTISLWKKESEV